MQDQLADWQFLGDSICMVSPWPPARDGIARFAVPLAEALTGTRDVHRIGIPEGGGDRVRALHTGLRALKLLADGRGCVDILVQYHPHYYVRGSWASRVASYGSWALLVHLRRVSFVVHELDDPRPAETGRRGRMQFAAEEFVRRLLWRDATRVLFLSEWQRERFRRRFPGAHRRELGVVSHGALFRAAAQASRSEARQRLGIDLDRVVALMIGFISPSRPDKGYDRALAALCEADQPRIDLHIVGSPIRRHTEVDALLDRLRAAAAASPQVHLHEGWLSDEEFDLWILAADAVLLPYREAATSGVAERARMLGSRVVTSGAGGLSEQLGPADLVGADVSALAAALRQVAEEAPD